MVPDLIGLSLEEACEVAAWADIKIDATSTERLHGPWGVVVAQSPPPDTRLNRAWRIHVLVTTPGPPHRPDWTDG